MSRFATVLLIFATTMPLLLAQSGQIQLDVKDPAGSPARASGTLTRLSAARSQSFETDDQGKYTFSGLALGRYRLNLTATGFASQTVLVDVNSDTAVALPVTLALDSETTRVDVVASTPLPGLELTTDQIPAPVQTMTEEDLKRTASINLFDAMNQRLNSVFLNDVQSNPFQPDLNYRGYTASPLLGTPQGISVYLDGVRMNQPFGDVVSWDLIPRVATSETTLIPGSDPLFGLNTLGGAISVRTKDGYTNPGTSLTLAGGQYGRITGDLETGGSKGRLSWYGASTLFFEDGWRDNSPSNVRQFMGKVGWQASKTTLGLTIMYANNQMNGNGIQEQRFLNSDYKSVYTRPDITGNKSPFANLTGRHSFTDNLTFFGNAYYRYIRTSTFNGDINVDSLDQSLYQPNAAEQAALKAAGYTGFPTSGENASNTPFPYWRCIAQGLLNDEPGEKCNGLLNRTNSQQQNVGFTAQLAWVVKRGELRNQFTVGGAYDWNGTKFQSSTQLGYLNPDRTITPIQSFADGVHGGKVDGEPLDTRVNLHGNAHTGSAYFSDTFTPNRMWNITIAGRYNRTTIENRDQINPGGGSGSLDGNYTFDRFNPAVGVTFNPVSAFNIYGRYSESSRAPTSIELGCADPASPCKLPNAMAGDPSLQQVISKNWEAGYRGQLEGRVRWSAGWFRGTNRDDIMFVGAPQNGFGYFKNFGKTLRQGAELDLDTTVFKHVNLGVNYTFLDATYQSPEEVNGTGNSANEDALAGRKGLESTIEISPGNRIPLSPRHMGKFYADIQATSKFSLTLSVLAFGSSYARGNENNQHVADGVYYLGPGKSPGYVVANLGARYQWNRRLQIFGQINNLFNTHYYSAAMLGPTGFTNSGNFIARPFPAVNGEFPVQQATFFAPGAPITIWGGVRIHF
jgi:outer membrane receptor protein involved in Fe transport